MRVLPIIAAAGFAVFAPLAVAQAPAPLGIEEARALRAFLAEAPAHGLASPPAVDDAGLMDAAANRAAAHRGRRLAWETAPGEWALRPAPFDAAAELARARAEGRLDAWLADLAPRHAAYERLYTARRTYAELVAAGGWPALADGPALREGDHDPRVGALRARLALEGFASPQGDDADLFDAPLTAAVRAFQEARFLAADGVAGADVRAALNAPAEARLHAIDLNLERERWLPRPLPATRVEVNIATAELTYVLAGKRYMAMRAIVGAPRHRTPMLAAAIEAVTLNPPWRVPASIANAEIWPAARRDPTYLARRGYNVVDGQLVQAPGPSNALGRVKFELPNPFSVYLHDTPEPRLFARARRTLSHGCVRLEDPRGLAEALLAPQGVARAEIDALIEAGATVRRDLDAPIPVYLLYRTAFVDEAGAVVFAPDPYGWDERLERLLAQSAVRRVGAPAETACQPPPGW